MYMIGRKRCPSCGVKGESWKQNPDVSICPSCRTFFNEFGVILESKNEKEEVVM